MCLTVDDEKTGKMKKRLSGRQTVWKVYWVHTNFITRKECVMSPIRGGEVKHGNIVSDRASTEYPYTRWSHGRPDYTYLESYRKKTRIYAGIHVCLTRKEARRYKKDLQKDHPEKKFVIFKCEGNMSDFVAAGGSQVFSWFYNVAVFTKVSISKRNWNKALDGDFR